MTSRSVTRRAVLAGGAGAAAIGLAAPLAAAAAPTFTLGIVDIAVEMIDGTILPMLAYGGAGVAPRVPGPILRVKQGASVSITIVNTRQEAHGFEITGIPGTRTTIAGFGGSRTVTFTAPSAGTYIYHDGLDGSPLYRLLGLAGLLVVEPWDGRTAAGAQTPYSLEGLTQAQRRAMSAVFDAMGTTTRFPGRWMPAPAGQEYGNQEKIWFVTQVDPRYNALIVPGRPIRSDAALTRDIPAQWTPRYFTINGRSGFDLTEGPDVVASNYIGEPTLVRTVNVGLATHSLHIHGNHILQLTEADLDPASPTFGRVVVRDNVLERDTWPLPPMQRRDVLLPYEVPPDIPGAYLGNDPASQFWRMTRGLTQEKLPLKYVMHCHAEMSNTAAGGNYPQGMVTHWEILGGVGGRGTKTTAL